MMLEFTPEERARIAAVIPWDTEEQITPVALGHIEIHETGIGPEAYAVYNGQRTLINVEDCEVA